MSGRDHPRVCGEHRQGPVRRRSEAGSSPRMRGTHSRQDTGIRSRWDHPRVCGEHVLSSKLPTAKEGSSPRMRGTHRFVRRPWLHDGIIPAYAGNTLCSICRRSCWKDHPRVCGEHMRMASKGMPSAGSSPRMRGTLCDGRSEIVQPGIIPAYAGNTGVHTVVLSTSRDHPRVCGEH